ncbi:MAG: formate dehydrogenase accessory sulfurtransferase FdhD [Limisphaerales bacterium]
MNTSESPLLVEAEVTKHRPGETPRVESDWLAREEPLEIRVRGKSIAITMRTPGHDDELACGFLVTEGILKHREDVIEVAHCETGEASTLGNVLNVFVAPSVEVNFDELTRHVFASSSCGLCGKASIESVHQHFPPISESPKLNSNVIQSLPEKLIPAQTAFSKTGGVHAAALFSLTGDLLVLREDVGRHNAVDKVLGWAFLNRKLPLTENILLVSGRASFEIMQKSLAGRIPIVAAVSAPSSLAAEFARESRQTLIGFLRGGSFNIYSPQDKGPCAEHAPSATPSSL